MGPKFENHQELIRQIGTIASHLPDLWLRYVPVELLEPIHFSRELYGNVFRDDVDLLRVRSTYK